MKTSLSTYPVILALFFCLGIFGLPGKSFAQLPGKVVTTSWLAENITNPNLLILDGRSSFQEYKIGHIPGAICAFARWRQTRNGIPFVLPALDFLEKTFRRFGVNKKSDVVVYSEGHTMGGIAWACRIAWTLEVLGHESVAILDGGISQWIYDGRPLETKVIKPTEGDFSPSLVVNKLATLEDIRFSKATLVDFRVPARYFGVEKGRTTLKYGHIPGSLLLPADWLPVSRIPKVLRSKKELGQMALGAGIPANRDKEIIALCDTAHFASLGFWVLEGVLGYKNVRLYDGSLVEYTRFPLPLERYSWPSSAGTAVKTIVPLAPVKPLPQTPEPTTPFVIEEDEGC